MTYSRAGLRRPTIHWVSCLAMAAMAGCSTSATVRSDGGAGGTADASRDVRDASVTDLPRDAAGDVVSGSGGRSGSGGQAGAGSGGNAGSGGAGSGGVPGSGGAGSGGDPGPALPFGYKPTTLTQADAAAAYQAWKTKHLEDCSGGVYRVRWEDAKSDATVSEGIGYGMLLTVAYNDKAAFDGLWTYYNKAKNGNGLMNWLRYGCDAHWAETYSKYPDGAATDADLDAAMALIMAKCRWGTATYGDGAAALINAIKNNEIINENGRYVLLPGDSAWFHQMNGGCINPSYFAPGYFRAFASFVTQQSDKDFWNKAADDTYTILGAGQNASTGLVRNWTNTSGGSSACASSYNCPDKFGDDAARTPWRIATDYVWWGKPAAKAFADKMTGWAKNTVGITNLGTWYSLDGVPGACTSSGRIISVGSFACAAIAYDQTTVNQFAAEMKNITDPNYFERTLRAIYMLLLTGGFTTCGGAP